MSSSSTKEQSDGEMNGWIKRRGDKERKEGRRKKEEEMMMREGGGKFCWEMYFFLFIRHALIFEGMKIILSNNRTVGIGGDYQVNNGTL